jgi:hypothetical protein
MHSTSKGTAAFVVNISTRYIPPKILGIGMNQQEISYIMVSENSRKGECKNSRADKREFHQPFAKLFFDARRAFWCSNIQVVIQN